MDDDTDGLNWPSTTLKGGFEVELVAAVVVVVVVGAGVVVVVVVVVVGAGVVTGHCGVPFGIDRHV